VSLGAEVVQTAGASVAVQVFPGGWQLIVVAALCRQLKNIKHYILPLDSVRAYPGTVQMVNQQMSDFMGDGLLKEVSGIVPVQSCIETQQVALRVSSASCLPAQIKPDFR